MSLTTIHLLLLTTLRVTYSLFRFDLVGLGSVGLVGTPVIVDGEVNNKGY